MEVLRRTKGLKTRAAPFGVVEYPVEGERDVEVGEVTAAHLIALGPGRLVEGREFNHPSRLRPREAQFVPGPYHVLVVADPNVVLERAGRVEVLAGGERVGHVGGVVLDDEEVAVLHE